MFEFEQFGEGTRAISLAIARSKAFSLAGGGDTLAAIEKYNIEDGISYISTGGGAFLEFVEGKTLPAVAVLEDAGKEFGRLGGYTQRAAHGNTIMLRRTKIVATVGPATDDLNVLTDMMREGLDVVRLNASHGTVDDRRRRLALVREARESR